MTAKITTAHHIVDPRHLVSNFLAELPWTIKETYVVLIWHAVVRREGTEATDFEGELLDLLLKSDHPFGFGALLCTVSAIDHYLRKTIDARGQSAKVVAEEYGNKALSSEIALMAPLIVRHIEMARQRWVMLREGPLTAGCLAAFEFKVCDTAQQRRRQQLQ
jgi:hypothetical protein